MRCPRCGNENPENHRFCGMCGASLLEVPTAAVPAQSASSPANSATQTVAATKTLAAPVATRQASGQTPIISGPSFLGLNQPAPAAQEARQPQH